MQPISIKQTSMDDLVAEIGDGHPNNRLVQRLGNRTVYLVGQGCW